MRIYFLKYDNGLIFFSELDVREVITHPLYDGKRILYDYAILRTKELIPFTKSVNAACLPQFSGNDVTDGKNMKISGWGKVSKNQGAYDDALVLKVSMIFKNINRRKSSQVDTNRSKPRQIHANQHKTTQTRGKIILE